MTDHDHDHDWVPLRNAVTGDLSDLEVCDVEGCPVVRAVTPEGQAALAELADEAERGYDPDEIEEVDRWGRTPDWNWPRGYGGG